MTIQKFAGLSAVFFLVCSSVFGEDLTKPLANPEDWSIHFQATTVTQQHGYFNSPYSGINSFSPYPENKTSLTSTLFLGRKLWQNGEFYLDPELSGGQGLSSTHGIAGFPNGEIYRVDSTDPKGSIARAFFKQVFGLGGTRENIKPDQNQLCSEVDKNRITLVCGKFSLNDYFDNNSYSHDPRTQFLNLALMDNGAWDYAADTRGYTWGFMLEYNRENYAVRVASVLEPKEANQMDLDLNIPQAHGDNAEFEYRYSLSSHPGKVRVLAYANHAQMGNYGDALKILPAPDITQTRSYCVKYGFGLNIEQEITKALGSFLRAGWNDGATESWAFTEIDRTLTLGLCLNGSSWKRPDDTVGVAVIVNGLSPDHRDYLAAGGYGFIIGDGKLNYAFEEIAETFYSWKIFRQFAVTGDFQFVNNPAYNQDRGPVEIFAVRLHYEL